LEKMNTTLDMRLSAVIAREAAAEGKTVEEFVAEARAATSEVPPPDPSSETFRQYIRRYAVARGLDPDVFEAMAEEMLNGA
jgi:hypothetical protein